MTIGENRLLEVQLEGVPEYGGAVRVDDLYRFLQQLSQVLTSVENDITGDQRGYTAYTVVGLSYSSPATIRLEAVPKREMPSHAAPRDIGAQVVSQFAADIQDIQRAALPHPISDSTFDLIAGLAAGLEKNRFSAVRFGIDGYYVAVSREIRQQIAKLRGSVYQSHGSFRGKLDAVNLHSPTCVLNIYPLVGPTRVRCTFPKGKFPNIGALLEQIVDVQGALKFRGENPHPYEIAVTEIAGVATSGLPLADEIVGSMPELTASTDPLAYLRDLRGRDVA